ncbi:MAG TPA: response regulator [Terriglobales bacterium]|nr:response regulator [Terriglobales bacterium]
MVDVSLALLALKRRIARVLGTRIELVCVTGSGLDQVESEPASFERATLELAMLARLAMPFGGRLSIETANLELEQPTLLSGTQLCPGHYVLLEMVCLRSRPGAELCRWGFDPDTRLQAFDDSGIRIAREIFREGGGALCEYNEPGRSLTFRVYLPSCATSVYSGGLCPMSKEDDRRPTILLVEDEGFVRNVACEILQSAGYDVITAKSGAEALQLYRERGGQVSLLVTDVVMPGMNGLDLAEQLSAMQPGLKTIYMSGYTDNAVLRQDVEEAGIGYLQKPFTPDALTCMVRRVLEQSAA